MLLRTRAVYSNAEPAAAMPAFTPIPARPTAAPPEAPPPKKRPAAKKASAKPAKKKSRKAASRKPRTAAVKAAPVQRRGRTAPVTMNVETAFSLLGNIKKKEIGIVQAIVAQINPLPRNSRLRVMQAVATILQ